MPSYEQVPVRLQCAFNGTPLDASTGKEPVLWRAVSAAIQLGLFDSLGNPIDPSNLASLNLIIQESQDSTSPTLIKTLTTGWNTFSTEGWDNFTQQLATFALSNADTDLSLGGASSAEYWVIIQGQTTLGNIIVFGAGAIKVQNASWALPIPTPAANSYHSQANSVGNSVVQPTSANHTEVITLTGAAGTRDIVLSQTSVLPGYLCDILFLLPTTAGIIVNVYSGSTSGALIKSFTTTGASQIPAARLVSYYNPDQGQWEPNFYQGP